MLHKSSNKKAFTLIEIVIAISILSIILGTAYSVITQIVGTKRILDDKRDISLIANAIVRRLGKELQLATDEYTIMCNAQRATSTNSLKFIGSDSSADCGYSDSLTFIAMEGGQYLPDGGTHTGLVQITYRLAKDPESTNNNVFSLVREEIPYATLPNTNDPKAWDTAISKSFGKKMVFPVAENVTSFTLKYFDLSQNQWLNEWGQNQKEIPSMIYYSISLLSPLGNSETYATAVPISAGK